MRDYKQKLESAGRHACFTIIGLVAVAGTVLVPAGALAGLGWLSSQLGGPFPSIDQMRPYPNVVVGYATAGFLCLVLLILTTFAVAIALFAAHYLGKTLSGRGNDAPSAADDELRHALMLADDVTPLPAAAHAALVTLRARLAAAQGVSVEQLVAKAVQP